MALATLKNFVIEYKVFGVSGVLVKEGTMRIKRVQNAFFAKTSLDKHLRDKHKGCGDVVMLSCKEEDSVTTMFNDIFGKTSFII